MSTEILDPSALLARLPALLPESSKRLGSPHDGIASLLHSSMTLLGFRLLGTSESGPTLSDSQNVLPDDWNKSGPSHYTFRYKHEQSSLEFHLTLTKLGPRTLINAIAVEVCAPAEKSQELYL
jgi:proteasome inhibitor subunit 1 (PI31)